MSLLKELKKIAKQITSNKDGNLAKWYVVADKKVVDFILSQPTSEWEEGRNWFGWNVMYNPIEKEWYIWDHVAFQAELKNSVFNEIEWSRIDKILDDCEVESESTPWRKVYRTFGCSLQVLGVFFNKDYPPYRTLEEDALEFCQFFADEYHLSMELTGGDIFFEKVVSTAEDLYDKAIETLEKQYPDLERTGYEQGDFPEDPDDNVDFSREYTFTAGKLFGQELVAGGWIEYRHDWDDKKPYINFLMGVARNGDFEKGNILKECEGLQGWYDIDTDTWSMEIGFY